MADYSWGNGCCGSMFGHERSCVKHPMYKHDVMAGENNMQAMDVHIDDKFFFVGYACLNGCGAIVHNIEEHMQAVHGQGE